MAARVPGAGRNVVPAGIAAIAVTFGLARYAYGLFVPDMRATFGLSSGALGAIATGSYAVYLAATGAVSVLAARTGPRAPILLGCACAAVGMAVVGLASSPAALAVGVLVAGAAAGLAYPPYSDAVAHLLPRARHARALALIGSGTAYGVILAGPIALLAGASWRVAWMAFAACALAAGLWNLRVLPRGPLGATSDTLPRASLSWLITRTSLPLLSAALIVGFGTSVYWTFAVDMIVTEGGLADASGRVFLVILGLAGALGGGAGALLHRFGARRSTWATLLGLVASLCLLPAAPSSWPAIAVSAVLFGGSYFVLTAVFGLWSVRIFPDRPSAGFGATFFVLSLGQLVGPALGGAIADLSGLEAAFYAGAALTLLSFPFAPRDELAPEPEPEPAPAAA